ncbi:MAG: endo-1,4-beta-xylanase [Alistipes sp.]|nr:endo-1,4-beta-xylanase [Alistipes sp.]
MRKFTLLLLASALAVPLSFQSCTTDDFQTFDPPAYDNPNGGEEEDPGYGGNGDYTYTLKELAAAAGIRVGAGVTNSEYNNTTISEIVHREFDNVTFGNEMKNSSIVSANGTMNFSTADAMVAQLKANDIAIFGHTLGWHSQQSSYYINLVNGATESYDNLKTFVDFEDGQPLSNSGSWTGEATVTVTTDPTEVFVGDYSLKVVNTVDNADFWRTSLQVPVPNVSAGENITVAFWIKAAENGSEIRVSTSDLQYLSNNDVTTQWQRVTQEITVSDPTDFAVCLDVGRDANTYFIDNIRVYTTPAGNGGGSTGPTEVLAEDFETIQDGFFPGWRNWNGGEYQSQSSDFARSGSYSLKIDNYDGISTDWTLQAISPEFTVNPDGAFDISIWAYSTSDDQYTTLAVSYYDSDGNESTDYAQSGTKAYAGKDQWAELTWTFTAPSDAVSARLAFRCGYSDVELIYFDDLSVVLADTGSGGGDDDPTSTHTESAQDRIDYALKQWVFAMMERYGDDVYAWDALNEIFSDDAGQVFRTNYGGLENGLFYWGDYLGGGEKFAEKVCRYAKAIKPDAILYVNDYNLEAKWNPNKLPNLCDFAANADYIDGVGTQMHMSITTEKSNIDDMFQQMAATGKLVRVSELDISINNDGEYTELTEELAQAQAEMYAYVVESYFTHVPAAQRAGITIWGVTDDVSWLTSNGVEQWPLLFDAQGEPKASYDAFYKKLRSYTDLVETRATDEKE